MNTSRARRSEGVDSAKTGRPIDQAAADADRRWTGLVQDAATSERLCGGASLLVAFRAPQHGGMT